VVPAPDRLYKGISSIFESTWTTILHIFTAVNISYTSPTACRTQRHVQCSACPQAMMTENSDHRVKPRVCGRRNRERNVSYSCFRRLTGEPTSAISPKLVGPGNCWSSSSGRECVAPVSGSCLSRILRQDEVTAQRGW
jgi:hypothetical protein